MEPEHQLTGSQSATASQETSTRRAPPDNVTEPPSVGDLPGQSPEESMEPQTEEELKRAIAREQLHAQYLELRERNRIASAHSKRGRTPRVRTEVRQWRTVTRNTNLQARFPFCQSTTTMFLIIPKLREPIKASKDGQTNQQPRYQLVPEPSTKSFRGPTRVQSACDECRLRKMKEGKFTPLVRVTRLIV